jgi:hypothetical protein
MEQFNGKGQPPGSLDSPGVDEEILYPSATHFLKETGFKRNV